MDRAWKNFLNVLAWAAEQNLARADVNKEYLIITDASDQHWSAILLQTELMSDDEKKNDLENFKAEPLFFLSGTFAQNQIAWHISQKELFPIILILKRFQHVIGENERAVKRLRAQAVAKEHPRTFKE